MLFRSLWRPGGKRSRRGRCPACWRALRPDGRLIFKLEGELHLRGMGARRHPLSGSQVVRSRRYADLSVFSQQVDRRCLFPGLTACSDGFDNLHAVSAMSFLPFESYNSWFLLLDTEVGRPTAGRLRRGAFERMHMIFTNTMVAKVKTGHAE